MGGRGELVNKSAPPLFLLYPLYSDSSCSVAGSAYTACRFCCIVVFLQKVYSDYAVCLLLNILIADCDV